jgi:ADP-ribose pyrophosphatase YjhB (NUDIX family)
MSIRMRLPLLYVEAVPVRLDGLGQVVELGVLLRASPTGEMTRTLVSGRVMFGETLREALFRHLEKDLGPMAFPQLPPSPVPFSVAEYFPMPGLSAFTDERQHAVSLAYVVPVTGTCEPRQDALEVTWLSPEEAASDEHAREMEGGRGVLLRAALASVGRLG